MLTVTTTCLFPHSPDHQGTCECQDGADPSGTALECQTGVEVDHSIGRVSARSVANGQAVIAKLAEGVLAWIRFPSRGSARVVSSTIGLETHRDDSSRDPEAGCVRAAA